MKNTTNSWNLTHLFKNDTDPKIEKLRKDVIKSSYNFINKWKKRNDYLTDPEVLKVALDEYNNWLTNFGLLRQESYYFDLKLSLDQNNPKIKARVNKAEETAKKIQNDIQFFELNIARIKPALQKSFLNNTKLTKYNHFLKKLFELSSHLLSDPEEKILNLKSATSYDNWVKMTSGLLAKEQSRVMDEKGKSTLKNFSEIYALMNNQKKPVRDCAANSFNKILTKNIDIAENELNSVLQDKKTNDELRNYKKPDEARLLGDDIDEKVVRALINSVTKNFDISQRYYQLKAKLMGVKKLKYHERNVEYGKISKSYKFEEGVEIIEKVTQNLDSDFHKIFSGFLEMGLIDIYPKLGKVNGAFCTYGLITHPTYILLNWNKNLNDVLTFAHELGHGINNELVKKEQNAVNFGSPVSTAEVASTFMEDFVLQKLLEKSDDELKLSIMMMKLNGDISSIFRQIAFYNFELDLHQGFREKGYLSKDDIGILFQKHMVSYMGSYVEQSPGSQNWWVYVNHFRYYFYVYSYASGLIISKSLQNEVKKNPEFINIVKEFLSTGLSDSPKNIFRKMGIDITDEKFWNKGLAEVEILLKETERLAIKLGKA